MPTARCLMSPRPPAGQLNNHRMNVPLVEGNNEAGVHSQVSFTTQVIISPLFLSTFNSFFRCFFLQNTFIGLPQMKAYNSINIRFMFRTFEENGLLLYNASKASDFISVELVGGRLKYMLNLGYGHISITVSCIKIALIGSF